MNCNRIFFFAFSIFLAAGLCLASIFGNVRGVVHDPDHRPVQGAQISLRATASDWSKTSQPTTVSLNSRLFPWASIWSR